MLDTVECVGAARRVCPRMTFAGDDVTLVLILLGLVAACGLLWWLVRVFGRR